LYSGKPIIGIAGGIGSGKSFIAKLFADAGCLVLSADDQVRTVYADPAVRETLEQWWGPGVINSEGQVDRRAIAQRVFERPDERRRLEALIHPRVAALRDAAMAAAAEAPAVPPAAVPSSRYSDAHPFSIAHSSPSQAQLHAQPQTSQSATAGEETAPPAEVVAAGSPAAATATVAAVSSQDLTLHGNFDLPEDLGNDI